MFLKIQHPFNPKPMTTCFFSRLARPPIPFDLHTVTRENDIRVESHGENITTMFPAILIFGDSTVDTGNNNYIATTFKGNHYHYRKDFPTHFPTGRFSNGRLSVDFLASMLGVKETIPPFLQPGLSTYELLTGVSFASAGSGYDTLTTAISRVLPMSKQLEYFKSYKEMLKKVVGEKEAQRIINHALVTVSAGTNE